MVTIISSIDAGQNFQPLQMTKHTLWLVSDSFSKLQYWYAILFDEDKH